MHIYFSMPIYTHYVYVHIHVYFLKIIAHKFCIAYFLEMLYQIFFLSF